MNIQVQCLHDTIFALT